MYEKMNTLIVALVAAGDFPEMWSMNYFTW